MMTTLRSIVPLGLFLVFLAVVGYLLWNGWNTGPGIFTETPSPIAIISESSTPTSTTTSTPSPTQTPIPSGVTVSPALTPTPTPTPITPTPTDVIDSLDPTPTYTPTSSATPSSTATHTPAPTSISLSGEVKVASLNVRGGPGIEYGIIGAVYQEDQVAILGRAPDGSWLKVRIPGDTIGWVATEFISLPVNIASIDIAPVPPPPPDSEGISLKLRSSSNFGRIGAHSEQEYTFFENQTETLLILMFEPNINLNTVNYVQFVLYFRDANGNIPIVGNGSRPASDRDGDLGTGELVWRGGPLTGGTKYHLRLINNGSEPIKYCLATTEVYHWDCSQR